MGYDEMLKRLIAIRNQFDGEYVRGVSYADAELKLEFERDLATLDWAINLIKEQQ